MLLRRSAIGQRRGRDVARAVATAGDDRAHPALLRHLQGRGRRQFLEFTCSVGAVVRVVILFDAWNARYLREPEWIDIEHIQSSPHLRRCAPPPAAANGTAAREDNARRISRQT